MELLFDAHRGGVVVVVVVVVVVAQTPELRAHAEVLRVSEPSGGFMLLLAAVISGVVKFNNLKKHTRGVCLYTKVYLVHSRGEREHDVPQ